MSVSIHWAFHSEASSPEGARGLVERLRGHALTLPFQEVGEVVELEGDAANFHLVPCEHPHNGLLCQALGRYRRGGRFFEAPPTHVLAFETMPGPGCAEANFGLCRYPPHLDADGNPEPDSEDEPYLPPFPSSLSGWRWPRTGASNGRR